jgi:hypothetical protein
MPAQPRSHQRWARERGGSSLWWRRNQQQDRGAVLDATEPSRCLRIIHFGQRQIYLLTFHICDELS